jgi:CHRD domain-containing protein
MLPMRYTWTLVTLLLISLFAQTEEKFKIRITPVPLDGAMRATVAGSGNGSATLTGSKLNVNASFEGIPSPATTAKLHKGLATGVRGSAFQDLTITKATKGTVSGVVDLTPDQVESLRQGKLYIQISSEKSPEGTLWGWILK